MQVKIEPSWEKHLKGEFEKEYFAELTAFVKKEYKEGKVYPAPKNIFRAFDLCPFEKVKVVILGQDPYHGERQANGLAFAVDGGTRVPPSLQNIYKEIESDLGDRAKSEEVLRPAGRSGDLTRWAEQDVLLLNATLTVRAHSAGSHQEKGWEQFTDAVIRALSEERAGLVFMLWGNYAKAKGAHIDRSKHLVLEAPHPSPFSVASGFFGCKHFSKANDYLVTHNETPIDWL
ncbi:MAG: uracil-DNA glycosylase [Patescibacteria group bacterium]|nr:uracil-DNA glycosylase [Patescibacteria group bacterium]